MNAVGTEAIKQVIVTRDGPVAKVTLANPPFNTFGVPILRRLTEVFHGFAAARGDERPRAILLGSGVAGVFSQGVDPAAVLKVDLEGRREVFLAIGSMVEAIWFSHIPVVCDISGPALAGGAVLATIGDFAVIDGNAGKIAFSEVKVGLPVPYFIQRLVMAKVNPMIWNDVLLLGRNIDAEEALRTGFANAVYRSDAERTEVLASALGRIVRLSPQAITATLRDKRAPERVHLDRFRADLAGFADFLTDDFLGKGLRAIVKGEAPKF